MAIGTPKGIILGPMTTKSLSNRPPGAHFVTQEPPIWSPQTSKVSPIDLQDLTLQPKRPQRPPIWSPQTSNGGPAAEALAFRSAAHLPRCAGRAACKVPVLPSMTKIGQIWPSLPLFAYGKGPRLCRFPPHKATITLPQSVFCIVIFGHSFG